VRLRGASTRKARTNDARRRPKPGGAYGRRRRGRRVGDDERVSVMNDGWPVKAALADVVAGDRVYAQGGVDRSDPAAPVFMIRWMLVRYMNVPVPVTP
jgi:hypothetical protein